MNRVLYSILVLAAVFSFSTVQAQDNPADTINVMVNGVRQGFWRIEGKNGKVDEGQYVDGKKHGKWKSFSIDGSLKSIVTYKSGRTEGDVVFYDVNGVELERGYWNVDHWEGNYVRFHPNGQKACEFVYDSKGRRNGQQKYYHDNGVLMYEGVWGEGRIKGVLVAYDREGHKILERNYDEDGKFVSTVEIPVNASAPPPRTFTGTGIYTLYTLDGKIDRKGNFVKGELVDGDRYVYRPDGTLKYIEVYAKGELVRRK